VPKPPSVASGSPFWLSSTFLSFPKFIEAGS
jgi:hypothetical protein